jgi:hypothetical protein
MTYAAPSYDFYDDGLVHGHDWSRSTPPGQQHKDSSHGVSPSHERDEGRPHEQR